MNKSNTAITVSKIISLIQLISGVLLSILFGICIIYYVTDANYRVYVGMGFFITSLICEAIGIVLIVFSRKRKKLIKMFREYVSYISSNQNCSIADIARAMNSSQVAVKKNIQLMIDKNFFVYAHINQETNRIVINGAAKYAQKQMPEVEFVPIKCKCCGGMNKVVKGRTAECEFCGSPIKE